MKKCNIVFNILTVIAYFYGILLCATLILIPLGVYCVISAHRYSDFANFSAYQLSQNKKRITNWIIFGCVVYFPFGLIGLLCLKDVSNNVVVEDTQQAEQQTQETMASPEQAAQPQEQPTVEVEIHTPETEAEKAEKLAKLERFKQNGLITKEEFEQAKADLNKK